MKFKPAYTLAEIGRVRLIIRNRWSVYSDGAWHLFTLSYKGMTDRTELTIGLVGWEFTVMINVI